MPCKTQLALTAGDNGPRVGERATVGSSFGYSFAGRLQLCW